MNIQQIERDIAKIRDRTKKEKKELAERRAALADYFFSVSEPISRAPHHPTGGSDDNIHVAESET